MTVTRGGSARAGHIFTGLTVEIRHAVADPRRTIAVTHGTTFDHIADMSDVDGSRVVEPRYRCNTHTTRRGTQHGKKKADRHVRGIVSYE